MESSDDTWSQADRDRIALYRLGHSVKLIAQMRNEEVASVVRSVNLFLDAIGERRIEA